MREVAPDPDQLLRDPGALGLDALELDRPLLEARELARGIVVVAAERVVVIAVTHRPTDA